MTNLNKPILVAALLILASAANAKTESTAVSQNDLSQLHRDCTNIARANFASNVTITLAEPRPSSEFLPSFCQVQGTIHPNIGFEARLPLNEWNGKFFMAGCGGFCGVLNADKESQSNAINYALRKGYAALITDGGHQGSSIGDGKWALDNPQAEQVYAHRVLPLGHAAGHELIEQMYKSQPAFSYFSGCSNGGRLAAMAAQRYPTLFDGIVAGCPVLNLSINGGVFGPWVLQSNTDDQGRTILDHTFAGKLAMLEANAYAECDGVDGMVDGVISKPQDCSITLSAVPVCEQHDDENCLTNEQRQTVLSWYRGPHNSKGEKLFAGMPPGSERYWTLWYLGGPDHAGPGTMLGSDYGRYLGYPTDPEGFTALDFNFDTDVPDLSQQGQLFNALDPDLSAMHAANAKMIMWHGLADPLVLADQSRDYYEQVVSTMGKQKADDVVRLFLAPGLGHCWELPAALPDNMDILHALEAWVERGIEPNQIPLAHDKGDQLKGVLNAYPKEAEYVDGQGNVQ